MTYITTIQSIRFPSSLLTLRLRPCWDFRHALILIQLSVWAINVNAPEIIQDYKDVFGELGFLKGDHRINIDTNPTPVIHPPCKIPISLMKKLIAELERTCKLDVIEKIDEPTDWVSSVVIVEKGNSQLRLCLDPRDLNSAIKCHHHPLLMRFLPN